MAKLRARVRTTNHKGFQYSAYIPPESERKLIDCKYCGGSMRWYHSAILGEWVAIEPNSYREHDCSLSRELGEG